MPGNRSPDDSPGTHDLMGLARAGLAEWGLGRARRAAMPLIPRPGLKFVLLRLAIDDGGTARLPSLAELPDDRQAW